MKSKILLIALFLLGGVTLVNAQYVDQKKIGELDTDYIRVWSDSGPLLSYKITVRVDYGQGGRISQISDDRRRPISFDGMIAVLNLLSKEGFELIEVVRDSKDETEIFYLKRKPGFIPPKESTEGN